MRNRHEDHCTTAHGIPSGDFPAGAAGWTHERLTPCPRFPRRDRRCVRPDRFGADALPDLGRTRGDPPRPPRARAGRTRSSGIRRATGSTPRALRGARRWSISRGPGSLRGTGRRRTRRRSAQPGARHDDAGRCGRLARLAAAGLRQRQCDRVLRGDRRAGGGRVGAAGDGFLSSLCVEWEGATAAVQEAGVRTVFARTGLVVARKGGAWGKLFPLFKAGLGGRMGSGDQYWSFVSLHDEVAAIRHLMDTESLSGPFNLTAPEPLTNREITEAMGRVLHRPTFFATPGAAAPPRAGRDVRRHPRQPARPAHPTARIGLRLRVPDDRRGVAGGAALRRGLFAPSAPTRPLFLGAAAPRPPLSA